MTAVAERLVPGLFARTKINCLIPFCDILHRRQSCSLVGPVAKRLRLASAAGAPPIFAALLNIHFAGFLLRDHRFCHDLPLYLNSWFVVAGTLVDAQQLLKDQRFGGISEGATAKC